MSGDSDDVGDAPPDEPAPRLRAHAEQPPRRRGLMAVHRARRAAGPRDPRRHPGRTSCINGAAHLSLTFLTEAPREGMTAGGIFPAIFGMVEMVFLMTLAGVPGRRRDGHLPARVRARAARASRASSASPSPTWRACRRSSSASSAWASSSSSWARASTRPSSAGEKVYGQPALVWAALTLAVLTLPVVIVATEEALRAVPRELREASLALGATKFQTVLQRGACPQAQRRHPHRHDPGRRRAARARSRPSCSPAPPTSCRDLPEAPVVAVHVAELPRLRARHAVARRRRDASRILYATVLVLLALTFVLNIAAILVRARVRRRASRPWLMADDMTHRRRRNRSPPLQAHRPRPLRLLRREEGRRARDAWTSREKHGHRAHRPVGLRQVDLPPLPQPHARAHPRRAHRRARCCSTATHIYGRASTRSTVRRRVGMVFQKLEPVPDHVDPRERARPACASAASTTARAREARRAGAAAGGAVGRGEGPPRPTARSASRAASSSASASRARSRSSPRCC